MVERRLYAPDLPEAGGDVELGARAVAHLSVLRLEAGAEVTLFDGRGREARGRVVSIAKDRVAIDVEPAEEASREGPRVVLCQCLPKGKKLDSIVRAATELGVAAIHLVSSERSVQKLSAERAPERARRLRRIAEEAARQSGSAFVPDVLPPAALSVVAARAPEGALRLAFAPDGELDLHQVTAATEGSPSREAWLVVGPEGGLSPAEVAELTELHFQRVRLFDTVLRVETAAPVVVGLTRFALRRPPRR